MQTTRDQHCHTGNAYVYTTLFLALCFLLFSFPRPSHAAIVTTGDVDPDDPGTWTRNTSGHIGYMADGTMDIDNDSDVSNYYSYIGYHSSLMGAVTVDGAGSTWTSNGVLNVGYKGNGTLDITSGGTVSNSRGYIGYSPRSTGAVTVDGGGSTWANGGEFFVGRYGNGTLNITADGLVSVAETLTIDYDENGDGFINMATGGMLALDGDGHGSLGDFLAMISGTDAIRYWDGLDWAHITSATLGSDYTLSYSDTGDLAGYTVLTVNTPEPAASTDGDLNGDGEVNGSDLNLLLSGFESPPSLLNTLNLEALLGNYGRTDMNESSDTVPEPSSCVGLLALCLTGLLARRRRKMQGIS